MSRLSVSDAGSLPALAALTLSGAEAVSFAQRICANDVAALVVGQWQWNCVLSPQGRVLSLFRLWRLADEVLTIVVPGTALDAVRDLLARYRLRAKVAIEPDTRALIGSLVAGGEPDGTAMRSSDGRWLALVGAGDAAHSANHDLTAAWRSRDVAQGVPWLDPQATEAFTPQALSLDRLAAFSVRKGCYPGQEIVARMHFLGQNKRELRRFASVQPIDAGSQLWAAGEPPRGLGTVVTVATGTAGCELLAVVQRAQAEAPLFTAPADGAPLHALTLDAPPLPA